MREIIIFKMKEKKKRKVGSGRRKGRFSFTSVPLTQLNEMLGPKAAVVISRKWAETVGLQGTMFAATPHNIKESAGITPKERKTEPEPQAEVTLTEW